MNKFTFVMVLVSCSVFAYYVETIKPGVINGTYKLSEALNVDT